MGPDWKLAGPYSKMTLSPSLAKEPAMILHLPLCPPDPLARAIDRIAFCLQARSALRLPALLAGVLFAKGRRTVTSWFRAAGISTEFRQGYTTIWACGRNTHSQAIAVLDAVEQRIPGKRLIMAIDDTPSKRYGPHIEGAGLHHNPTPGPAGEAYFYGHVWVNLAAVVKHPDWGTLALPLLSELYIRQKDIDRMDADHRVPFRTKLQEAAELVDWLDTWRSDRFEEVWLLIDGGYSKQPVLRQARAKNVVVFGRLPCNAALYSLPETPPPHQRGRKPIYGKQRLRLHLRAGQVRGWQEVQCIQYDNEETKKIKTFLATWHPAGGVIRVVLVQEEDEWRAYFCTKADATPEEILEAVADRGAIEQTFKDLKEVWGADEQQVRNLSANVGCWNINSWMYSLVEVWALGQDEDDLVDRSASPWDREPRRPSHQDKRKALQSQILERELREMLANRLHPEEIESVTERVLALAA